MSDPKRDSTSIRKILVGFDGSDGGRDALGLTRTLASISGATVVVTAILPYGPFPVGFEELQDSAAAWAEPLFEEARIGPRRSHGTPVPQSGC